MRNLLLKPLRLLNSRSHNRRNKYDMAACGGRTVVQSERNHRERDFLMRGVICNTCCPLRHLVKLYHNSGVSMHTNARLNIRSGHRDVAFITRRVRG